MARTSNFSQEGHAQAIPMCMTFLLFLEDATEI